jgi:hypothetical protein
LKAEDIIDSLTILGLCASAVSIALALFAIWQAWQFFKQAKESETRTEVALAEIKSQTDTLQKLTGSQIRSLTKAVTSQSPTEKVLIETLANLSATNTNIQENINAPKVGADTGALRSELISAYIALHHYTALTNNAFTFAFRNAELDESLKEVVLSYINHSYDDFSHMENIMPAFENTEIKKNILAHLFEQTENTWKPAVRSVSQMQASGEV